MVIPFGRFPSTVPVPLMIGAEKRSWSPLKGPGGVLSIPGGYIDWARNPTVRAEKARVAFEKKTAVRAFCTETSQEKIVASGVRNVPSTAGATPGWFGLLTTEMKTSAIWPTGRRIAARVTSARAAAFEMICVTSAADRRACPEIVPATGSPMIGALTCPLTPPRTPVGHGSGASAVRPVVSGATEELG